MVLKKISSKGWQWAYSEMGIIPESKIVIAVIVGECFKKIVIGYTDEEY